MSQATSSTGEQLPQLPSSKTAMKACSSNAGNGDDRGRSSSPKTARGTVRGYPGSKGGNGVWQTIICQLPPHETYIEAFAGSAQVLARKRPSTSTIAIDSDAAACGELRRRHAGVTVICGDAVAWLEKKGPGLGPETLVYCDPPYLACVRADPRRRYYGHEFSEEWLHGILLEALKKLKCPCLISGYQSELYSRMLSTWRRVDYVAATRGGPMIESLWCNFPEPAELHDYRWIGTGFRERERIARKKRRWVAKLQKMPMLEKASILAAIDEWRRRPMTPNAAPLHDSKKGG